MNSRALVSICIPCHNAAPYVGAALDSVLAQTWRNLEVIVVDDGSTDGSDEVLETYQARGVKVVHQQNKGQCAAINRALAEIQGDYIKFFDADDLLSFDFVERQMMRLNGRTDAIASAEWGRFYNDDLATFHRNSESVWRDMEATEWLVESWRNARPMMQCGLWLIPRQILEKSGGWDESLSLINDFEFFARILCTANEVKFASGATLYYRSGLKVSLSGGKNRKAIESAFRSVDRGTRHLLRRRNDVEARQSCANILRDFSYTYYPDHLDLVSQIERRVRDLGGSSLNPSGPPNFQRLRRILGWKLARRIQRAFNR